MHLKLPVGSHVILVCNHRVKDGRLESDLQFDIPLFEVLSKPYFQQTHNECSKKLTAALFSIFSFVSLISS